MPTKYSQVFALTRREEPDFSSHNTYRTHSTYCSGELTQGGQIICAILYPVGQAQPQYEFHLIQGSVSGFGMDRNPLIQEHLSIAMRLLNAAEFQQIENLLAFTLATNPFYAVFDIQSGQWSYGFDLSNLIKLP